MGGIDAEYMGVLTSWSRMKVLFLMMSLTASLGQALQCYNCTGTAACRAPPGGHIDSVECPSSTRYCEYHLTSGSVVMKCSTNTNVPADFEAVEGDPNKSCKESRGGQEVQCLCSRDLCNDNYMAQPQPNLSTSLTSTGVMTCLATLLVTLTI